MFLGKSSSFDFKDYKRLRKLRKECVMKKIFSLLCFSVLIFTASTVHAICSSDNWCWVNPLPQGNDVNDILYVDSNTAWAVGDYGTILSTLDGGTTWMAIDSGTDADLTAIHFIDGNNGWIAGSKGVLLHTTDGGENWSPQVFDSYSNLKDIQFLDEEVGWTVGYGSSNWFPCPQGLCYSQGEHIYKTTDGGISWRNLYHTSTFNDYNPRQVVFVDANIGWVLAGNTIYKTADGGENWEKLSPEISLGYSIGIDGIFFLNADKGWAVGDYRIIVTGDGGQTWSSQHTDISGNLYDVYFHDANNGWVAGLRTLLYTNDGGVTWQSHIKGPRTENESFHVVRSCGTEEIMVGGNAGALFSSSDGGLNLTPHTTNFAYETPAFLKAVSFPDEVYGWVVNHSIDTFYHTEDGGRHWALQQTGMNVLFNSIYFVDRTTGWAVGRDGTIMHTQNGGESWTAQTSGTSQELFSVHFVSETHGWVTGNGVILGTGDGGATWSLQYTGSGYIKDVSFVNHEVGWATGAPKLILYTENGGDLWEIKPAGDTDVYLFNSIAAISPSVAIAVGESDPGTEGRIFRTEDGGVTWNSMESDVDGGLNDIQFADSKHGWVVGYSGTIYYTGDGGVTWVKEESGTNKPLTALCVRNTNHRWVVGSYGAVLDNVGSRLYDYLGDGDVDGADLAAFLMAYSATELPAFALEFGRIY
jgi:photosystem II stability/assembly factor-like uncharacterized protein